MARAAYLLIIASLVASPAAAQITFEDQAPAAPAANAPAKGLDRIVCEREETIGTRLGARKVCLTVLQWQQKRIEQRQDFERVQRVVNQEPAGS
jgi:hypothetical protein